MSVVFVVAPAVLASWPILCGAVAGAAAALGYKALSVEDSLAKCGKLDSWVDVSLEGSEIIADAMRRESEFIIAKDDVTATFRREADGRCTVHVGGVNKTEEELNRIGQELVGKVTQQYAYHKVVTEMKNQGFTVTNEEITADRTIRIQVQKFV